MLSPPTLPDVELVEAAREGDRSPSTSSCAATTAACVGWPTGCWPIGTPWTTPSRRPTSRPFAALPRFRAGSDFGTWLYRITYNACIDELRQRKRAPVSTEDPIDPESGRPGPERIVSAAETVRSALAELPVDQRVTVVLVDGEGFDHREAAKILGVAPGTVASRLHRARAALRRVLGEEVS